ncbi:MAG: HipA N-terminal domain-containing protein [Campylobacterota bacterium]|nr:HipA N-terminal domain-containing protein [Campylobacterota bacterium]
MSENRLQITMSDRLVASIWVDRDDETYKFQYCDDWIKNGFAVSPHLKLEESSKSGVVRRFLENLIPEGTFLYEIGKED